MRVSTILKATLALTLSLGGVAIPSSPAVQLADGTVSFEKSPRLINATSTYKETNVWGATYYFTLELPEDAGEPLQRVTINQRQGVEDIDFRLEDSRAFEGTPRNKGERLTLNEVTEDEQTKAISVTFEAPVMPGKTVTIGLRPVRNPWTGGVYLFGVTAFPAGEKPYGLYLGVGRLHFYDNDIRFSSDVDIFPR
ncbi:MAG: DUF2808 domain-containing protein [Coleofasciculus sp. S288]|nr:DUF2808 domain-containing protein [Coleofasciculus sp. S288]